jgi:hypothetical protein
MELKRSQVIQVFDSRLPLVFARFAQHSEGPDDLQHLVKFAFRPTEEGFHQSFCHMRKAIFLPALVIPLQNQE